MRRRRAVARARGSGTREGPRAGALSRMAIGVTWGAARTARVRFLAGTADSHPTSVPFLSPSISELGRATSRQAG